MSAATGMEFIVTAKKLHRCSWCGQRVDMGASYWRWRYFADSGACTVKMHPECEAARIQRTKHDNDFTEWSAGEFERGRGCDCEKDESCRVCHDDKSVQMHKEMAAA